MQTSKPRKSRSVGVGLGNLHFNMDPQTTPIYTKAWEPSNWGSQMDFWGLWTLKLYSIFCASVLCTFIGRICFIEFSKGCLTLERQRMPALKEKKNGIVSCHFLLFYFLLEWRMAKSAWKRSRLHTMCITPPWRSSLPTSPHFSLAGPFLVPNRTSSQHHLIHSRTGNDLCWQISSIANAECSVPLSTLTALSYLTQWPTLFHILL